jgi:hypothetical protein
MGLFDIFSSKPAQDAANAKIAGLNSGYTDASAALNTGLTNATGYYNQALSPWSTLAGTANNAYSAYGDALGLNGPQGNAAAVARFQASPGYSYALQSGLDAIDRGAAARGSLSSGGTAAAEQAYGTNLANQGYSSYLQSFAPYLAQAPTIAAGQSGIYSQLGGLNYANGSQLANLAYQKDTGVGDANASADLAAYNASGNLWGALFSGAKLATGAFGGGGLFSKGGVFGS